LEKIIIVNLHVHYLLFFFLVTGNHKSRGEKK